MAAASDPPFHNQLLARLSPPDSALLRANFEVLSLPLGFSLERPNRRINHVYFIDDGIASVVAIQKRDSRVEVGLIGQEGISGSSVVLGVDRSPHSTYMQVAGRGRRIATDQLRKAMKRSASLHGLLLKYVHVFAVQTAHTAIANGRAKVDTRLARWILMAHDRVHGNLLPLTHEFLALMLGVQRSGVTLALQSLSRRSLIETGRGQIVVLDRKGIERFAGPAYGVPESEFSRVIG